MIKQSAHRERCRLLLAELIEQGNRKANTLTGKPFAPIITLFIALGRAQEARTSELEEEIQALKEACHD